MPPRSCRTLGPTTASCPTTPQRRRRQRRFPALLDRTSRIELYRSWEDADDAREWLLAQYRRDRTAGQEWTVILGVEKAGMSAQLDAWFTGPLGIPHVALGGYASQSLVDDVRGYIEDQQRLGQVLIYAGDHDPTGVDIDRDFAEQVGYFDKVIRVALLPDQIEEYGLVSNPDPEVTAKLSRDPRAAAFEQRFGELEQYEVDALAPETLRDLYESTIDDFWDEDAYQAVLAAEEADRRTL